MNLQFFCKNDIFDTLVILIILYLGQNCLFSFVLFASMFAVWVSVLFVCRCVLCWTNRGLVKLWVFIPNSLQIQTNSQSLLIHSNPSLACYLFNKLFNSIACLLYFINLQLVISGRTWILLYLGRTVYKHLGTCLALYGGPRWTLCQFQRDQSNNKQFDSFLLYIIYFLYLGTFLAKTEVGQTSPEWIKADPDELSWNQYCFLITQTSQRVLKSDIFQNTNMN